MIVLSLIVRLGLLAALETAVAAPVPAPAPTLAEAPAPKVAILGFWKGTSACAKVEDDEFCRDEPVVYNFVDVPGQPATVSLKAGRIVDDVVQPMYALYVTYRPDKGNWTSEFERPGRRGVWTFIVDGDNLTGTAMLLPKMRIVRNVMAKRTAKERVLER